MTISSLATHFHRAPSQSYNTIFQKSMHLKKLEISGFKSFAKSTILEFPAKITAIVGPNGSGKSNIAESVRWVLGEQSMKSLRGKKGEDLIWNGSPQIPRMGKASVTLIFDNQDKRIPMDFSEVSLTRKIFRDGLNEYYINDSQVRLKDVVEMMARIGLGETKHNIISQGEVDRILMATPRERREMLEEALGLRVYQIKKNETERKLDATENNMKQVESLVREIAPHLKFLRAQAQKAETRETVEIELKQFEKLYFAKEEQEIQKEQKELEVRSEPFLKKRETVKSAINELLATIKKTEQTFAEDESEKTAEEKKLLELEAKRRELERELGRLEGRLEVEREKAAQPKIRVVDTRYIHDEIKEFLAEMRRVLEEEDQIDIIRSQLLVLVEDLDHLLNQIAKGTVEEKKNEVSLVVKELEKTVKNLQEELKKTVAELERFQNARVEEREQYRAMQQKIRELDQELRVKQDEERELALSIERLKFDDERLNIREHEWLRGLGEASLERRDLVGINLEGYETMPSEDVRKKIERLRLKLEEIGGIDTSVIKEFQETEARHLFLTKELEDLKHATTSLRELIKELDQHIKEDFKNGFSKIKDEFHNYFRIIFGGGRALLQLIDVPVRGEIEEEGVDPVRSQTPEASADAQAHRTSNGVEISIDLPKKRIKGLTMLSGGERALTSIALLFSITAVNPPPFLILDETDAALDEANSQRYGAILRELAKKTQLLLVTHNRETMKCASILYGVTMGDDGVSKLLSLRLEEAEAYTNR